MAVKSFVTWKAGLFPCTFPVVASGALSGRPILTLFCVTASCFHSFQILRFAIPEKSGVFIGQDYRTSGRIAGEHFSFYQCFGPDTEIGFASAMPPPPVLKGTCPCMLCFPEGSAKIY